MPVVGLEPICKIDIPLSLSMFAHVLFIFKHKLYISIYHCFLFLYFTMQHEMQHEKIQYFFVF